jgi:hypothetical protein
MSNKVLEKYIGNNPIVVNAKDADKYGRLIYSSNKTMRDIATIMEHPEMRQFIESYLISSKNDIAAMIKMLQIYKKIDRYCNSKGMYSAYIKIAILYELYCKSEYRRMIL